MQQVSIFQKLVHVLTCADGIIARFPQWLVLLGLRIALAVPFLYSGLTKFDGFLVVNESAILLFTEEYKLHIFGNLVGFPFPAVTALLAGTAEVSFSILVMLGFATRFAALGLLCISLVIQLIYPEAWRTFHLAWGSMAGALMIWGAGKLSVDALLICPMFGRCQLQDRHPAKD